MTGEMGDGDRTDVVLVGAGIMSATLAILLREIAPGMAVRVVERLGGVALESTGAMNNAGTGHAGNCELNYTPAGANGAIDVTKAVAVNESFEDSLSLWASLVARGALPSPAAFISAVPHMSLVWGTDDVSFLRRRHRCMIELPHFAGMDYTEDARQLAEWAPLVTDRRAGAVPLAATRLARGTDVDFGALARAMLAHLVATGDLTLHLGLEVRGMRRVTGGWRLCLRDRATGSLRHVTAAFVFLGAGGGALPLLLRSGVEEGRRYGGFPVRGLWLVCRNDEVSRRHNAKVYGKASVGAPPMSVPHLDTRLIDGRRGLLFGPFAGFSTRFLKAGSHFDWPLSIRAANLRPMLAAGLHNVCLVRYLVGQLRLSPSDRLAELRAFVPTAVAEDWQLAVAGQRVQVIKPDSRGGGTLEFGTEVVTAADGSLAALLGASPGASTAVTDMIRVLERCLPDRARSPSATEALRRLVPSLAEGRGAERLMRARARNDEILGIGPDL